LEGELVEGICFVHVLIHSSFEILEAPKVWEMYYAVLKCSFLDYLVMDLDFLVMVVLDFLVMVVLDFLVMEVLDFLVDYLMMVVLDVGLG